MPLKPYVAAASSFFGPCTQAESDRSQYRALPRAILATDEIDLGNELGGKICVAHEVLETDL